jgi:fatty acid desaturase
MTRAQTTSLGVFMAGSIGALMLFLHGYFWLALAAAFCTMVVCHRVFDKLASIEEKKADLADRNLNQP